MDIIPRTFVIIGYGSIGKRHLEHVSDFANKIIIIDPIYPEQLVDKAARDSLIVWYPKLDDISSLEFKDIDIGVVANWGPDHFNTVKTLIEFGMTRIVLEKPMVCSIANLDSLSDIVREKRIHIVVNQGWHYMQLAERINKIASEEELGPIAMINATGGARCISTAGSHIIHLAHLLLGQNYEKISGNFRNSNINPRNKELSYLDGTLTINFSEHRYLNLSYANSSSIEGKVEIYWRDALGILEEDNLVLSVREPIREFASTITRYGRPTVGAFSGNLPLRNGMNSSQLEGLYRAVILEKFDDLWKTFNLHCNSNRTLLLALISNQRGKIMNFNDPLSTEETEMKFSIS